MNLIALSLFIASATALLGSPGPGIAALIAVGRANGFAGGLRYFAGLQVGLALAAGISAAGLFSVVKLVPGATQLMQVAATLYLLWLAWQIASAPVGEQTVKGSVASSFAAGMFLGVSNPKSLIAFVSLFASQTIIVGSRTTDTLFKWIVLVLVMIAVDLLWLFVGVGLRRAKVSPRQERILNVILAAMIVVAVALSVSEGVR